MINPTQLRDLITRVLKEIPHGYSEDAVELMMMIAAHESELGFYLKQMEGGPARGLFGNEPKTHDATWEHGDSCKANAKLLGIEWSEMRLEYDFRYQIFIARQRLFMFSETIPGRRSLIKMGEYCKKHWNTEQGKATPEKYINDYLNYCVE